MFKCLDASRPWIVYWILHALYLLDVNLNNEMKNKVIDFLSRCQSPTGGFGGGPGQQAHLAPTYASINALCTLNTEEALKIINRKTLLEWLLRIKNKNGSMSMHEDGEEDLRGVYCAITVAKLTNLEQICPNLFDGCAEWIALCQTYEGGFGAVPECEAHGGYTFCGVAALKLLGKEKLMDVDRLLYWLVNKQMKFEGGFQGRTNKLVDSCYSFWQAGQFPIIHSILVEKSVYLQETDTWLFDQGALQEYILICCQAKFGGLIDKPGKYVSNKKKISLNFLFNLIYRNRDFYHSCYALSGLSVSQYFSNEIFNITKDDEENLLNITHPLYNISTKAVQNALEYFVRTN